MRKQKLIGDKSLCIFQIQFVMCIISQIMNLFSKFSTVVFYYYFKDYLKLTYPFFQCNQQGVPVLKLRWNFLLALFSKVPFSFKRFSACFVLVFNVVVLKKRLHFPLFPGLFIIKQSHLFYFTTASFFSLTRFTQLNLLQITNWYVPSGDSRILPF